MNTRRDFVAALFRSVEAGAVACCVLRNYERLLTEEGTADIDLLVEKRDLGRFNQCLQSAAAQTGQRFVHYARYVNHSCVFWNAQSSFTRVDFDTEIRWRVFPVLPAQVILASRQKRDGFDVPHPRHEAIVLFVQALWVGKLEQRYRGKLASLYEACPDKDELRQMYREAFGGAGDELMEFHSQVTKLDFTDAFCSRLKRSIVRKTFTRPAASMDFIAYVVDDVFRFLKRLRRPPGISLLYATSMAQGNNLDEFMRRMEFLFPTQKCLVWKVDLTRAGIGPERPGLGVAIRGLRTLFKGGLFVQFYRLAQDADLSKTVKAQLGRLYPSRCFVCAEDSHGRTHLTHLGTGRREESDGSGVSDKMGFSSLLIGFISTVLERERNSGL